MATWNWNTPGVHIRQPLTRMPIPAQPTPWSELAFDPLSLFDLRRHLGARMNEPGRFMASQFQFHAADIAFLAGGASGDGRHAPPTVDEFFPEFMRLREVTPPGTAGNTERKVFSELVRRTIWDLATKWDRVLGSTTMILHVDGTTHPAAPLAPEYLKANVYLPPSFVQENPGSHQSLASIAQLFLEHIGVPTVAAWTRRGRALNWSLGQQGTVPVPSRNLPVIPSAEAPGSSHYVFRGRPATGTAPTVAPVSPPSSSQVPIYDIDQIILDAAEANLLSASERNGYLEGEVKLLRLHLGQCEEAIEVYDEREVASQQRIQDLEAELAHLQHELKQSQTLVRRYRANPIVFGSPPPSPSSSRSKRSGALAAASTSPSPPPYVTFGSPSASVAGPSLPRTPRGLVTAEMELGAATHQFLIDNNLLSYFDAVRLICAKFSSVKWGTEIAKLSRFPAELKDGLLEALEADSEA
ncbi:hypothetical protein DFH09DRAFT_1474511 [Mycena vulgaris]|nr:hypothetical protein DFH09DRAFT_1474511 [Mycena vulgaris]